MKFNYLFVLCPILTTRIIDWGLFPPLCFYISADNFKTHCKSINIAQTIAKKILTNNGTKQNRFVFIPFFT